MSTREAGAANADTHPRFTVAGVSDPGRTREYNEDVCVLWNLLERTALPTEVPQSVPLRAGGLLLAVCDGMGGAVGGDIASDLAADTLTTEAREAFDPDLMRDPEEFLDWLVDVIHQAGERIYRRTEDEPELAGMGSTITAAGILPSFMVVAHVGDSRLYHLRHGKLRQLTVDHSFVNHLVSLGRITPEQARRHEQRNLLLQAAGAQRKLDVDRLAVPLEGGDRVLLCSDGLTDLVPDHRLETVLNGSSPPPDQARTLVDAANEAGGLDNVSVIVAQVD